MAMLNNQMVSGNNMILWELPQLKRTMVVEEYESTLV